MSAPRKERADARSLWHFTCDHGYAGLGKRGLLRPNFHPLLPELGPVIWLTDDPAPRRDAVGLTSEVALTCDRMQYRYRVHHAPSVIPWAQVRGMCATNIVAILESYADASTWWISGLPLRATLEPFTRASDGSIVGALPGAVGGEKQNT